ncbi:hypothetical protein PIB30_085511 [Stylosanthes scabra]|uniref:Uncharacterized protein n=1 Tax=Stylosanthes scabra TaxID=79078 RepID=A0ABU6RSR2_9FABA|nr:hypothetical protein [Stylosanthes scabra]
MSGITQVDTQFSGAARRNIRSFMVDLNIQPEGSSEGSNMNLNQPREDMGESHDASVVGDLMTHHYLLNSEFDNNNADNESLVIPQEEKGEEEEDEDGACNLDRDVNGASASHIIEKRRNRKSGDTTVHIFVCKPPSGKITEGWTLRLYLMRYSQ